MNFMVSMVRDSAEGRNGRFECSADVWSLLLEIGRAFGWKPQGTTYLPIKATSLLDTTVQHDYLPGGSRDRKCIAADDANALSTALRAAQRSPHLAAMVGAQRDPVAMAARDHAHIDTVMIEFVEYAGGGAFSFALAN